MSAPTTEEIVVGIFTTPGLSSVEATSMAQRLIKLHDLKEDDNDKSKIFAKMRGQIPKVFPKQSSQLNSIPNYY